jgi:hypothetical protein
MAAQGWPPLRTHITLAEAMDLLVAINDVADREGWSMVGGHLQVWAQVMLHEARKPRSRPSQQRRHQTPGDTEAWLKRQLDGLGKDGA